MEQEQLNRIEKMLIDLTDYHEIYDNDEEDDDEEEEDDDDDDDENSSNTFLTDDDENSSNTFLTKQNIRIIGIIIVLYIIYKTLTGGLITGG